MTQFYARDAPYPGNNFYHPQQLDNQQFSNRDRITLPKYLPGVVTAEDYVFFQWDSNFPAHEYTVVVDSIDTAGPTKRSIGKLDKEKLLPYVIFDAYGKIGVIPTNNPHLPGFWTRLNRGSTYTIPRVNMRNSGGKTYQLLMSGMITSGTVNDF
jgi:hypothetical protein